MSRILFAAKHTASSYLQVTWWEQILQQYKINENFQGVKFYKTRHLPTVNMAAQ